MLMSKSRLEKFLYALYSLDSSDLPMPLSRIEELYKCWVTGEEAPTFEPLSRVEKYLMAILGVYDVDSLPNPLSRVEVLLYKLAIGDDNLDDVKSFLSEHEELLAEIIRNGGDGGNINIEYVLYTLSTEHNTLYNTAEKPVKSAILKGNTLVNIFDNWANNVGTLTPVKTQDGYFLFTGDNEAARVNLDDIPLFKRGVEYTFIYRIKNSTYDGEKNNSLRLDIGATTTVYAHNLTNGIWKVKKSFSTDETNCFVKVVSWVGSTGSAEVSLQIIEGDYTNVDIPYFEGIQSVKMPVLTTSNEDGTKTNILTTSEEVELRGIGEVKDEFNLFTGEMTQRIGKMVIDGREEFGWGSNWSISGTAYPLSNPAILDNYNFKKNKNLICEQVPILNSWGDVDIAGISPDVNRRGLVLVVSNELTGGPNNVAGLRTWLNENPLTIFYEFITDTVKTVDLSVVDQDGNDTELSTFNDITHVTLSSEGLIPEAELEVATKNEEVLNTMSLEMDDISATQTTLEETSNTQSENVDATMIATTEIYEELL